MIPKLRVYDPWWFGGVAWSVESGAISPPKLKASCKLIVPLGAFRDASRRRETSGPVLDLTLTRHSPTTQTDNIWENLSPPTLPSMIQTTLVSNPDQSPASAVPDVPGKIDITIASRKLLISNMKFHRLLKLLKQQPHNPTTTLTTLKKIQT
jgi:hypothetical protein